MLSLSKKKYKIEFNSFHAWANGYTPPPNYQKHTHKATFKCIQIENPTKGGNINGGGQSQEWGKMNWHSPGCDPRAGVVFTDKHTKFGVKRWQSKDCLAPKTVLRGNAWEHTHIIRDGDYKAYCRCVKNDNSYGISICNTGSHIDSDTGPCDDSYKNTACKPSIYTGQNIFTYEQCREECDTVGLVLPKDENALLTAKGTGCGIDAYEVWINPTLNGGVSLFSFLGTFKTYYLLFLIYPHTHAHARTHTQTYTYIAIIIASLAVLILTLCVMGILYIFSYF